MEPPRQLQQLPVLLLGFGLGLAGAVLLAAIPAALHWPVVVLSSAALLCGAVVFISRAGIRVEIFTREPIGVSTRRGAIQAEVTRLRI
jgi:hypothetical protein